MDEGQVIETSTVAGRLVVFRYPRRSDLSQFIVMRQSFHEERIMASHEKTDELKGRSRLDDILAAMAAERARWLFVELDGKLVGQGSAAIYSDTYVAVGVSLMREARGMGLGKKMMLLVEDEARKLKRDTLYLHVWSTNPVARTLYKDLGYEEIARRRISSDWTPGSMRT